MYMNIVPTVACWRGRFAALALLAVALGSVAGCSGDALEVPPRTDYQHTVSFVGYVYDGASGARISDFTIEAQVAAAQVSGTVASDGRYGIGPVSAWDDFTILISAGGYRPFRSHNARIGLPPGVSGNVVGQISSHQTLHFDAYVFPDGLEAPSVVFTIKTNDPGVLPSGMIRLRPSSPSLLVDEDIETPAGVPGQVWENDEDLQGDTLTEAFSNGTITIAIGELVYGVTYRIDIYDVTGYQPLTSSYVAGMESNKSFTLVEELHEPVVVVTSNVEFCEAPTSPSATVASTVTIEFNQAIEFGDAGYPGGPVEAADDGLTISSPNEDGDEFTNQLRTDASSSSQERAVSLSVAGNTVELSWSPASGLLTSDMDDPILSTTYTGLGNILVQRVGSPASAASLSAYLGQASIVCDD